MSNIEWDPRKIFEETLAEIAVNVPNLLALSCDSASGAGMGLFRKIFPERFIELGISEQNAIGVAAGLSTCGYIPVVAAIAPFISMRCFEQIRDDIAYPNSNVKIIGSSSGLAFSTLGSTHQALEDIAILRAIPNIVIFNPGDAFEVKEALYAAVIHVGPVYIRMPRHKTIDLLSNEDRKFVLGKGEIISKGNDLTILVTGVLANEAKKACELLKNHGLDVGMINYPTVKPMDVNSLMEVSGNTRLIVTLEEHVTTGGFGSAISEVLAPLLDRPPLIMMGVTEGSTTVGPYQELREFHGLTAETIAEKVLGFYKEVQNGRETKSL
jgi:transketolase